MPDDAVPPQKPRLTTRLSHAGRAGTHVHGFVNPPVHRGSTVLYPDMAGRRAAFAHRLEQKLVYGVMGGPTHWPLENVIAEIEGGTHCQIVSSGLAAITTPLLGYTRAGDHVLVPDSVYGPARSFCDGMLKRFGVETTYYDPGIDAAGIAALFQPNTTVLYTESPGSHTFEMQDIPALAEVAHARGAKVLMDNTWGIHFFQPFTKGVDCSIQALTKYVVGHSDVLLGSVTVNTPDDWERVRGVALSLGQYASPDDCWLALRGVRTMGVRLERQMESGLRVAAWLRERPEVAEVLHPGLPSARGHEIWKRDFSGACSLFGVVFQPQFSQAAVHAMAEALSLFGIGASWGGYESLALPTTGFITRTAGTGRFEGQVLRLHIGLEAVEDLTADLEQALAVLRAHPSGLQDPGS
ncbi:putative cystathionine beta-lyase [Rhodovastum atsumiense]|uniref:Cystathionine beta-lyase n=1 Tax=Rhodovastum atsumiense TaxID=504468 RepID=A0A5M6IQJ7_9PROT|nr:cystathionine beta-lyase [Rhodovastum atsumiense]KAA5610546.1 cystathionine beta-lyase [Rhodovastum atsumiense]CAH2605001.1 putative cystathionine beta-lyase [Rhodovastum atsumiense]